MPDSEIILDPVDFVTIGTVGPKGRRLFHLQAAQGERLISLILEKEQARALAEALQELLDDLNEKHPAQPEQDVNSAHWDMSLRDPIEPLFRVSQMGLGYDEERDKVMLVAQELVNIEADEVDTDLDAPAPQLVRMWGSREQMRALSEHTRTIVKQGRPDAKSNGHIIYYWT
jgi:uncharacterized repeat protein (TIGR03847 family)